MQRPASPAGRSGPSAANCGQACRVWVRRAGRPTLSRSKMAGLVAGSSNGAGALSSILKSWCRQNKAAAMPKRYVSIWFRYLLTDRHVIRYPEMKGQLFVFAESQRGRKVITAVTALGYKKGLRIGMTIADAKAAVQNMVVLDGNPGLNEKLLMRLAEWCQRYTPLVAVDPPDGLLM